MSEGQSFAVEHSVHTASQLAAAAERLGHRPQFQPHLPFELPPFQNEARYLKFKNKLFELVITVCAPQISCSSDHTPEISLEAQGPLKSGGKFAVKNDVRFYSNLVQSFIT